MSVVLCTGSVADGAMTTPHQPSNHCFQHLKSQGASESVKLNIVIDMHIIM